MPDFFKKMKYGIGLKDTKATVYSVRDVLEILKPYANTKGTLKQDTGQTQIKPENDTVENLGTLVNDFFGSNTSIEAVHKIRYNNKVVHNYINIKVSNNKGTYHRSAILTFDTAKPQPILNENNSYELQQAQSVRS